MTLFAVVVTFNRLDQLKLTVARLLEAAPEHLTGVLVVDNASDADTADWLAQHGDPRLHVLRLEQNSGGAGGFAAGMAHVRDHFDPDWLVVMDDDGRPEPGALAVFHHSPRHAHKAWGAAVRYPDGRICDMNRPVLNPFWSLRTLLRSLLTGREGFHLKPADYNAPAPLEVDGVSFVGAFFSRAALKMTGLPDAGLFIYGDDTLYSLRLRAEGGTIGFDPRLRFEHDCATLQGGGRRLHPLWKVYYFHRNQIMVYRRAAGPVLFWPAVVIKGVGWLLRARHYGADRGRYLRLLRHGVADGLRGRTGRPHDAVLGWVRDPE